MAVQESILTLTPLMESVLQDSSIAARATSVVTRMDLARITDALVLIMFAPKEPSRAALAIKDETY